MWKALAIVAILFAVGLLGSVTWWYAHRRPLADRLVLHGDVDLRQASVSFNGNERIAEVLVEEGDVVRKGQPLARLDTSRLRPQLDVADAATAAQRAAVLRLKNGSRPQEIDQARASLASARADAENAVVQFERAKTLVASATISRQDFDAAKTAAAVDAAKVEVLKSALDLALAGPRSEDIAQAEAQLRGYEAQLALIRQQLADAELCAPFDAIVRARLMEPGEMASPARPVLSLAMRSLKWVRAYVGEPQLAAVHSGMRASVSIDGASSGAIDGWVGFISPVAEFTPKTVETEDLRTSLVYEVRVYVEDAKDQLRLGMPATVRLILQEPGRPRTAAASAAAPAAALAPPPSASGAPPALRP